MKYVIAYGGTAAVLAVLDAVWLTFAGRLLYRPAIGSLMMESGFRLAPAIVFYVLYVLGVVTAVTQCFFSGGVCLVFIA